MTIFKKSVKKITRIFSSKQIKENIDSVLAHDMGIVYLFVHSCSLMPK